MHLERPNWNQSITTAITANNINEESRPTNDVTNVATVPEPIDKDRMFNAPYPDPPRIEPLNQSNKFSFGTKSVVAKKQFEGDVLKFYASRAVASRRRFKLERIETRVDNEVLFDGLESYTDDGREFDGQEAGILIQATAKDLFEDFEIVGGYKNSNFVQWFRGFCNLR